MATVILDDEERAVLQRMSCQVQDLSPPGVSQATWKAIKAGRLKRMSLQEWYAFDEWMPARFKRAFRNGLQSTDIPVMADGSKLIRRGRSWEDETPDVELRAQVEALILRMPGVSPSQLRMMLHAGGPTVNAALASLESAGRIRMERYPGRANACMPVRQSGDVAVAAGATTVPIADAQGSLPA